jgi:hypothetical protein
MRFQIKMKRTVEHVTDFEIEALNEDDAETQALKRIEKNQPPVYWEEDDTEYDFEEVYEVEDDEDDSDEDE